MTTALLLLALAAAAAAAPYGGSIQPCSTECPVAAAKFSYVPDKTYAYTYTGKSKVQLKGVEGGIVESRYETQVLVTVLGPCDLAISFKNLKVDGQSGLPGAHTLEQYPLVVAMTDGRVQRVCSHPDDDTAAINMKKGVASAMQNSLPSLSIANSGLNYTETDVVGKCPTRYEVKAEGAKTLVKKEKNHRLCQEQYHTPDETLLPHLMGPLPIQESQSICTQQIEGGIITSVVCEDKKVIRPSYGIYKFVEANQDSTMRLTSSDAPQPDTISRITQQQLVPRSLRYDYQPPKKEQSLVPQLEQTLMNLCQITGDGLEPNTAVHFNKAVHLMRRIPEQAFNDIYEKVRTKQICPQHNKLHTLFLDAIAFVHEPESVSVMVQELVQNRANATLAAFYSGAFYMVPRPNLKAIEALEPLFRASETRLLSAQLAAASMVNAYCRHNPHCYEEAPVRNLPNAIKQMIEQDLSSSSTKESQKKALSAFKTLGNMGVMTPEAAQVVLRYMQSENKKVSIRVAAAQAFRLAKCQHPATQQLVQYALQPGKNTEVRIASYLAAIPCANYEDLQTIVTRISYEENTQVRGFILSHLVNLQKSDAPEKESLRYLLSNIVIPIDFEADLRKYSRNLDLSYFSPSLGLGAELESNVIYAPGSFIPRSLGLNLTAALDGTGIPINIGEIGTRLEGLEPIIAQLFGPASYLKTSSYSKMFHDLISFIQEKWSTIENELQRSIRDRRSVDFTDLKTIFNKLYGPQSGPVEADVFARFLGQEINYASLSKRLQDIDTDYLVQSFMRYLIQTMTNMKNMNLDTARAAQLALDYSFPTIQGTPFKMSMEATTVAGIKMETDLIGIFSGQTASGSKVKILPSISMEAHGFIGYETFLVKNGLKMNTTITSSNGVAIKVSRQSGQELQIDVDIPNKMEIVHVKSETFLVKHIGGQPETKILPPSIHDPRIRSNSCLTAFQSVLGLKVCYDVDVPDIFQASSLPLGSPLLATLSINKTESSIKGYKVALTTTSESQAIKYAGKVTVVGSSSPKEANVQLSLKKESESYLAEVKLQSSSTRGEAKATFINRPEEKRFETDVSFASNAMQFTQAFMVDLKTSTTSNQKKYEVNIYSSPSRRISEESNIFKGELLQNYKSPQLMMVDISAKSKNSLAQYIPFSLEVGADLKYYSEIPLPIRLRKLEVATDISGWKITSFFRKAGDSDQIGEYSSALQVVRQNEELIDMRADLRLQGTPAVDFKEQFSAKAKVGQAEYKMQQMIEYQQTRTAINMQLTRSSDNLKLIEIVAEKDAQELKLIFQVQATKYMAPIKVAAGAVRQAQDYNAEALVMQGREVLVLLHGPVTFINAPSLTKLAADIKINNVYQLVSSLEFQEGKQAVLLEIKKQQQELVALECTVKTQLSQGPSLQVRVYLPALLDSKAEVSVTDSVIHASTDWLMLPGSSSPQRFKGFVDVNWSNKQSQLMVMSYADKDPSKKFAVDVIIIPESTSPAQVTMNTKVVLLEKTYNTITKVAVPFLLQQYRQRNSISMEVQGPEQGKWMIEVGIQDKDEHSASADLTFMSVHNNNYRLTSDLKWQRLDGPFCFEAEADIRYVSPQNKQSKFSVQATHHSHPQHRTIHLMTKASTQSMQAPLKITFSTENVDYSYMTKLQSEGSSAETLYSYQLQTFPEGGVKLFDAAVDLKSIRDVLKTLSEMMGLPSGSVVVTSAFGNKRTAYNWVYSRPSHDTHSIKMKFPSRTVEAEATYSSSKAGMKIYPNRDESEAKYEVAGEYIKSQWGGSSRYEGRMSHPKLDRDVTAVAEYTSSGSGHQGTFQLDVFPDTEDKITGSLSSVLRANNTIVIEASLATRVLQVKPKVTVEASWAAHTAAFNFTFQKTPSSPESFKAYAKYDKIARSYGAVSLYLGVEGRPVVDVSGVVEPRQGPYCDGFALLGHVHNSLLGHYVVNSTVCNPAFLDIVITKKNSPSIYKAELGLQAPYKAEVSISRFDQFQIRQEYISLIGIKLSSPRRLKVDFEYKPEEITAMKDFVLEEAFRVTEAALSWTDQVYREVERQAHQAGVPFPAPKIRALVQEAKNDIVKIYTEVIYNDLLPEWEVVQQLLRSPSVVYIKQLTYQFLSSMAHIQKKWATQVSEQIMYMQRYFAPVIDQVTEAVIEAGRWVKTGEEPEFVRRLVEEMQRTAIYQVLYTHIIQPIKETYPQQYQTTMDVAAKVVETFRQDLNMIQQRVLASPTLRKYIQKVLFFSQDETYRQSVMEWYVSQVTQRLYWAVPEPGHYRVGIHIPLYRPMYSLMQVVNMTLQSPPSLTEKVLISVDSISPVSVRQALETYYAWMPVKLSSTISPFNRSAIVVDDTEIVTFDGAALRMPRSPCKVLLASVPDVASVYMSHPQPSQGPEIILQAGPTKATIKPNMEVEINGRPVHAGRQTLGDLVIEVNSHFVTIVSPLLGVHRMKEERVMMVNASSWAFNHTRGLLGSYDNERANDRLMSNGRNASSLHELVASWQESPNCSMPPINPINPAQLSIKSQVLCDFLFFQMKPCTPVVSPKPFKQSCLAQPRPFQAARSYQSFCRMHGVLFPMTLF